MVQIHQGIMMAQIVIEAMRQTQFGFSEENEIYAKAFTNGRENGYMLSVYRKGYYKQIYVWIHNSRGSDNCYVRWDKDYEDNNMYSEETYNTRSQWFITFSPFEIVRFIEEKVDELFATEKKDEEETSEE